MSKRWKLIAGLAAVAAAVAYGALTGYRLWTDAQRQMRALDASSKAEDALRNAETALARLRFDREGTLLPGQIAELEQSKRGLAANLKVEKKKLVRGYELLKSPNPKDSVWAFEAAQRAFESVSDSCLWLQQRADSLAFRGQIAGQQIDLAGRERDSTRRALAEVEQSDVGLPGNGKLRLDESRALLAQGEAKLDTAKALMAGGPGAASSAAYDAAQAACNLFDRARGAAQKRSGLALEYTRVRLAEARRAEQAFEKAAREADDGITKLKGAPGKHDLTAAQAQLRRARERASEAEGMIGQSRRRFEAQDFEAATKLVSDAADLLDEATSLAEEAGRVLAGQGP